MINVTLSIGLYRLYAKMRSAYGNNNVDFFISILSLTVLVAFTAICIAVESFYIFNGRST